MRLSRLLFFLATLCVSCQPITLEVDNGTTPPEVPATAMPVSDQLTVPATVTTTSTVTAIAPVTVTTAISPVMTATVDLSLPLSAEQELSPESAAALTAEGLQIYRDQYCGICHQSTAAGTGGTFGPTHDGLGALAAQRIQDPCYQGAATTPAEYLYESLIEPQRYFVPGYELTPHRMPSYTFLTAQQLDALVQFLHEQ
jgi:hypothetical protein